MGKRHPTDQQVQAQETHDVDPPNLTYIFIHVILA
jgi:hypothetical protein